MLRIAWSGGTVRLPGTGISWELPLGMRWAPHRTFLRNNKKENPKHPFLSGASALTLLTLSFRRAAST
jgi:hypothetical protein